MGKQHYWKEVVQKLCRVSGLVSFTNRGHLKTHTLQRLTQ
jgi:hypothetical protein